MFLSWMGLALLKVSEMKPNWFLFKRFKDINWYIMNFHFQEEFAVPLRQRFSKLLEKKQCKFIDKFTILCKFSSILRAQTYLHTSVILLSIFNYKNNEKMLYKSFFCLNAEYYNEFSTQSCIYCLFYIHT